MPAIVGPANEPITLVPHGAHAFAVVGAGRPPSPRPGKHRGSMAAQRRAPAELAATALVSRESGSGTRGFFEQALRAQAGLEHVPPPGEPSSTTAIKAAVAAAPVPPCPAPWPSRRNFRLGHCAVTITGLNLNRTLTAVWAPGRRLAGPARDLYAVAPRSARRTRSPR